MKEEKGSNRYYLICERNWIYFILILVAGFWGSFTYLLRGNVFCNAQTGNVVLMGMALGTGKWLEGLYYLIPISAYMMGAFVSELFPNPIKHRLSVRWDTLLILIEMAVIAFLGSVTSTVSGVQIPDSSSVGEGVEATGTTVTVDTKVEDTSITTSNVQVSGNTLSALAEADTVSTVKIATNVGTLTISDAALNAIVTAATTDGTVADVTLTLSIKDTKTDAEDGVNSVTYEFTAKAGNADVFAGENNGTITVTVPAPTGVNDGNPVYVYYIADDGTRTQEAKTTVQNNSVTWDVTHFSKREVTNIQDEATYTKNGEEVTGTLQDAVTNADEGTTIYLNKNVFLDGTDKNDTEGALTITKNLTIDGGEHEYQIMASANSFLVQEDGKGPSLINIQGGVNVTLKNLTVNGMGALALMTPAAPSTA